MSDLTGRPAYQRCHPVKDRAMYDQYAAEHPYCQFCGVPASVAGRQEHCGGVGLSRHHIVKFRRSDERTNLIVACHRDHQLCEGILIRGKDGILLPKLTLGVVLSVKKARCPGEYNPERLEQLLGHRLPDLEPIPEFLEREWRRRRGGDFTVIT